MSGKQVSLSCIYSQNGKDLRQILFESFSLFLQREHQLGEAASLEEKPYHIPIE